MEVKSVKISRRKATKGKEYTCLNELFRNKR